MNASPGTSGLAVGICTKDNLRTIRDTIESVRGLAGHVLVVDSGSTDGTVALCESLGAEVLSEPWRGYAAQKQFLLDTLASHAWVLLLDSDESLSPELRESIAETVRANDSSFAGWTLNRKVHFLGDWLHHTFQPEWRVRLVRGGQGRMAGIGSADASVHETVEVDGDIGELTGDLRHDTWADVNDMCQRYIQYARLAAAGGARGGTLLNVLVSPPAAFLKQYVLKRGFLDGHRGLVAAGGAAMGTLVKHLFIARRKGEAAPAVSEVETT